MTYRTETEMNGLERITWMVRPCGRVRAVVRAEWFGPGAAVAWRTYSGTITGTVVYLHKSKEAARVRFGPQWEDDIPLGQLEGGAS